MKSRKNILDKLSTQSYKASTWGVAKIYIPYIIIGTIIGAITAWLLLGGPTIISLLRSLYGLLIYIITFFVVGTVLWVLSRRRIIKIRRFEKEDGAAVSKIIGRNLVEINSAHYPKIKMKEKAKVYNPEKVIEISDNAHMYVAYMNKKIIGCGAISSLNGRDDESTLLTIFILPEMHCKGVGKQIIESLEMDEYFLRAKRIEIPSSITACEFYLKCGYKYKNGIPRIDEEGHYMLEKFREV